jgi:hypothetical protein
MNISRRRCPGAPEVFAQAEDHLVRFDRFPMMHSIRKEVRAFMHAAETLLGPIQGGLSRDERGVISLYIHQIMEKYPDEEDAAGGRHPMPPANQ